MDWAAILRKATIAFAVVGIASLAGAAFASLMLPPAEPPAPADFARAWLAASSAAAVGAALREFIKQRFQWE